MGEREVFYDARSAKESRIHSRALRYVHHLMAYTIFNRRESDLMVITTELMILYCIVHNKKLDICHVITLKFKDVATKYLIAIKIGGLVTVIAKYYGFDMSTIDFDKVKGV